jgi:BirA family biotin operon repressor/biotin-[acetyl-CoA-carboxylase] ligase
MPRRTTAVPEATDRRIDQLLGLLTEHPMVVLSGAKIARQVGVSRSAVWRWVEKLRALGVKIKGHPKFGYQLLTIPDILVPRVIQPPLKGTQFGRRVHHFFKIHSTNAVALELATADEPHGSLVIAEEQTAGRGRLGRGWHSEKTSGIYLSVVLRPPFAPLHAPVITLAAGLAARDAVANATGHQPELRWPNNLLIRGKKVCGILTEMQAEAQRLHYVVVGIGVNVNHGRFPGELERIATSLRLEGGQRYSRVEILVGLLGALDHYYNRLLKEGPGAIIKRFTEVSPYARGRRVRVSSPWEKFSGLTAGLSDTGLLRVKRDDGKTVTVVAGDISEGG